MQNVQVERYDDSDSFFEMFEHDTFEREEELRIDGAVVGWLGYVDGVVCAGYDFAGNWGWTAL